MVRRLLCVLLVELQHHHVGISTRETAQILNKLDAASYRSDHVESTVKDMLDAGSRYKNLERALGEGALFLLGKDLAES